MLVYSTEAYHHHHHHHRPPRRRWRRRVGAPVVFEGIAPCGEARAPSDPTPSSHFHSPRSFIQSGKKRRDNGGCKGRKFSSPGASTAVSRLLFKLTFNRGEGTGCVHAAFTGDAERRASRCETGPTFIWIYHAADFIFALRC